MRRFLIIIAAVAAAGPALALEASDTMKAWTQASAGERTELLTQLLGQHGGAQGASIRKCLDEASNIPGHADLQISEIVKFCGSAKTDSDPV